MSFVVVAFQSPRFPDTAKTKVLLKNARYPLYGALHFPTPAVTWEAQRKDTVRMP